MSSRRFPSERSKPVGVQSGWDVGSGQGSLDGVMHLEQHVDSGPVLKQPWSPKHRTTPRLRPTAPLIVL